MSFRYNAICLKIQSEIKLEESDKIKVEELEKTILNLSRIIDKELNYRVFKFLAETSEFLKELQNELGWNVQTIKKRVNKKTLLYQVLNFFKFFELLYNAYMNQAMHTKK